MTLPNTNYRQTNDYVEFDILTVAQICNIDIMKPVQGGLQYIAYCPFCGDGSRDHGHLYLRTDTNEWRCVMCEEGGFALGLYAKLRCNGDTKQAYKELLGVQESNRDIHIISTRPAVKAVKKEEPMADIELRNVVYNTFLDLLTLQGNHRTNLLQRGLTVEEIAKNKYRSYPADVKMRWDVCSKLSKKYDLSDIPGFFVNKADKWDMLTLPEGYFVPVRDAQGRIQGLQFRILPFDKEKHDQKFLWFSTMGKNKGTGARQWVHVVRPDLIAQKDGVVWLTEGPLKADVSYFLSENPFLAVPGVSANSLLTNEFLKELGVKHLIMAFDMDYKVNDKVKKALERLGGRLREYGYALSMAEWETEWKEEIKKDGKKALKPVIKGIDDFLLAEKNKNKTVSREEKQINKPVTTVPEVIKEADNETVKKPVIDSVPEEKVAPDTNGGVVSFAKRLFGAVSDVFKGKR